MPEDRKRNILQGLTDEQVIRSRAENGENVLTPPARDPWWRLFLEKFDDPVIRILLIAAVIAIGVGIFEGKYAEGIGIVMAILLATTLAFVNEYKANREFDILNKVNDEVPVKVIRDGHYMTIAKSKVVVGDVVIVEVGEEVPADGRLEEAVSLLIDEASMTGESVPVKKAASCNLGREDVQEGTYPRDRLLRGTMIADGHGVMIVTAVGDATEIGKTAREAAEEGGEQTPLNIQLERLSKLIGVVGFGLAALTFAALTLRGVVHGEIALTSQQWTFTAIAMASIMAALVRVWLPIIYDALELLGKEKDAPPWLEKEGLGGWLMALGVGGAMLITSIAITYFASLIPSSPREWMPARVGEEFLQFFMIAVTLIVVAVPEGLAMSVTLSLAYSMRKMTNSNTLVRRMHACETIGAATVICSDKTGTLTMNQMRVQEVDFPCLPSPFFVNVCENVSDGEQLVIEAISSNTTANLSRIAGQATSPIGNPTESALILWLDSKGVDYIFYRPQFDIHYQLTFSTERKWMGTLGVSAFHPEPILHIKGAPEIVLERCSLILTPSGPVPLAQHIATIHESLKDFQRRGMRTLGFAYHEPGTGVAPSDIDQLAQGMTWLGFVAIADPVRADVPSAIRTCSDAGILVKIVTGDNPETAKEVGRQIGLLEDGVPESACMTGRDFELLSDKDASETVQGLRVLSRARPLDKLRLVRTLQERGHVVAVTGDGTNDAPALNHANVGLAMGQTGTAIAKEASDIILLDDSFNSIVNAVMWGRSLYQNIQRFILFQLTINVAALGIALLGPFIGVKLPLTVTQMLWVNLIMDTFAALALAAEPPHWDVMKRSPRKPGDFIVTKEMARNIFGVSGIFLVFLVGFLLFIGRDDQVTPYELSLFFTTFVMLQFWNLFNARTLGHSHSAFSGISQNKGFVLIAAAILIGQIFFVQLGGSVFRTVPLSLRDWMIIGVGTSVVLWIGEAFRYVKRRTILSRC
ncbi:MAG TPA: calcium-translocating P-type ATPase, PMCA-type [Candidatus Hydrogenedentes bacterium]|nr:calcium-translocating P-type ATPase, PMCA-type [Candidatus Hydrogenedentota bacterium]